MNVKEAIEALKAYSPDAEVQSLVIGLLRRDAGDDEMAAALRAKGWSVDPPWTKENCKHPPHMKFGQGRLSADGSGHSSWHCRACGKSGSYSTPPNPEMQRRIAKSGGWMA